MKTGNVKRSIVIEGHKTSISLEKAFWDALHDLATRKGMTLTALAELIDRSRDNKNRTSAIRVYVFSEARNRARRRLDVAKQVLA